jgi:hypothetical protein
MSDTSEIPAPPATPDEPTTVTPVDTATAPASTTETPDSASTAVSGASADDDTETTSEDSTEAPEAAPTATVVNTADGQYVEKPDGTKVYTRHHTYPISNGEWAKYEKTHAGDQARYAYVPGDKEYDPYSDPHVPNSKTAQDITSEIASYATRVLKNPEAEVSNIWNQVRGVYDGALENFIKNGAASGKVVE